MLEKDHSSTFLAGKNLLKSEPIFEVLGDLDELIISLSLCFSSSNSEETKNLIEKIQKELIGVGAFLATGKDEGFLEASLQNTEEAIKKYKREDLSSFVIPKTKEDSFIHFSRTKARALERSVIRLKSKQLDKLVKYLNLLSQLLFWLAVK
ncbi:ATP:cob(I)alamin adenosyltransferase [Patescibacteria group bacterium]|nr:ATP:cob(I)alamin adenosyltransferase [Patescibacteria group bacterium]